MNTPEKIPDNSSKHPPSIASEPLEGLLKDAVRAVRQSTPPSGFGAKVLAEAATWKHPVSIKPVTPVASRSPLIVLITASIAASLFFIWFTGESKKRDLNIAFAPQAKQDDFSKKISVDVETLNRGDFKKYDAESVPENLSAKIQDELREEDKMEMAQLRDVEAGIGGEGKDSATGRLTQRTQTHSRSILQPRPSDEPAFDGPASGRPGLPGAPPEGLTGGLKTPASPAETKMFDDKMMADQIRESGAKEGATKDVRVKESEGAESKSKTERFAEKNMPAKPAKLESVAGSESKADGDQDGTIRELKLKEAKQNNGAPPGAIPMQAPRGGAGGLGGGGGFSGGGPGADRQSNTPVPADPGNPTWSVQPREKAQAKSRGNEKDDAPADKKSMALGSGGRGGPGGTGSPSGEAGTASDLSMNRKPGEADANRIRNRTIVPPAPSEIPRASATGDGVKLMVDPIDRSGGAVPAPRFAIANDATVFFAILSDETAALGKATDLSGANLLQSWNWSDGENQLLGDIAGVPIAAAPNGKNVYFANGTMFDIDRKELKSFRDLGDNVRGLTVSPDGKNLLTQHVNSDFDCYYRIEYLADANKKVELPNQWGYTFAAGFSPDNAALALMDKEKIIHEYRLTDGTLQKTFAPAHANSIRAIEYSPNGKFLASSGTRGETYLWIRETAKLEHELKITQTTPEMSSHVLYSMKFSPDSRFLAASGTSNIFFWNVNTGEVAAQLEEGSGKAVYLRYSADGKKLTAISNLETIKVGEGKKPTKAPVIKEWDVPESAQ